MFHLFSAFGVVLLRRWSCFSIIVWGSVGISLKFVRFAGRVITAAENAGGDLVKDVLEQRRVIVLCVADGTFELFKLRLRSFIAEFTHHTVEEVDTTEGTGHDGEDRVASTTKLHLGAATNVREDIALTHLNQSKFGVVAVRGEILEAVAASTK